MAFIMASWSLRFCFLLNVFLSTTEYTHGQELIHKKNGRFRQKSFINLGIGISKPDVPNDYILLTPNQYPSTPYPSLGIKAQLGVAYFFTKHWGLGSELNGSVFSNNYHDQTNPPMEVIIHSSNWWNAHWSITPIYSIVFRKLVIDFKIGVGLAVLHAPDFSITYPQYPLKYEQSQATVVGRHMTASLSVRYAISDRIGCFANFEYSGDRVTFKDIAYKQNGIEYIYHVPSRVILNYTSFTLGLHVFLSKIVSSKDAK
jgi:hypothetical protein